MELSRRHQHRGHYPTEGRSMMTEFLAFCLTQSLLAILALAIILHG